MGPCCDSINSSTDCRQRSRYMNNFCSLTGQTITLSRFVPFPLDGLTSVNIFLRKRFLNVDPDPFTLGRAWELFYILDKSSNCPSIWPLEVNRWLWKINTGRERDEVTYQHQSSLWLSPSGYKLFYSGCFQSCPASPQPSCCSTNQSMAESQNMELKLKYAGLTPSQISLIPSIV